MSRRYAEDARTQRLLAMGNIDERLRYDAAYVSNSTAGLRAQLTALREESERRLGELRRSLAMLNATLSLCSSEARDAGDGDAPTAPTAAAAAASWGWCVRTS